MERPIQSNDIGRRLEEVSMDTKKTLPLVKLMSDPDLFQTVDCIAQRVVSETDLAGHFRNLANVKQFFNPTSSATDILSIHISSNVSRVAEYGPWQSRLFAMRHRTFGRSDIQRDQRAIIVTSLNFHPRRMLSSLITGEFHCVDKITPVHENLHFMHFAKAISGNIYFPNDMGFLLSEIHAHLVDHAIPIHVDTISKRMKMKFETRGIFPNKNGFYHTLDMVANSMIPYINTIITRKGVYEYAKWAVVLMDLAMATGKIDHKRIAESIGSIRYINENTFWGLSVLVESMVDELKPVLNNLNKAFYLVEQQELLRHNRFVQIRKIAIEETKNFFRSKKRF